ncbi:MAG: thioesterase family protein [bacterium]|nr:thioesterase family protein [bacterium]
MSDSYFTTGDNVWFEPTAHSRGPWNENACHGGPPTALLVRAMEGLAPGQRLARICVELMRPIPMVGFRVQSEVRRPGRSVTYTEAEIFDEERIYVRAFGMHVRQLDGLDVATAEVISPNFAESMQSNFPIKQGAHDLQGFVHSVEARYDPESSMGEGGPTTMWMRTKVPILPDEEPSPFQKISPLADCGNGISYNAPIGEMMFVNPDLSVSLHREPEGDWFCSQSVSHWQENGTGMADAELFDEWGPVGRAVQNLLLAPIERG